MTDHETELPENAARPASEALRLDRFERLLGSGALSRLEKSHVMVVGIGGVGSFAAEALARSGIGHLTLVDGETISATNLNRQLHALSTTLGLPKVEAMKARFRDLSAFLRVDAVHARYLEETADQLLPLAGPKRPDIVVDAIDNVTAKMHLMARCRANGIPIVSCMGAGGRLDPTRITSGDLSETRGDHFARDVRKFLRRRHGIDCSKRTGILAVWSTEPGRKALKLSIDGDGAIPDVNSNIPGIRGPRCQASAVFVTAAMGMTAASVVIRELLLGWPAPPPSCGA